MGNMPDINIVKYLSVNIKKAFDKGEIDKVYRDMYVTAEKIANVEYNNYRIQFRQEYIEKKMRLSSQNKDNELHLSNIYKYRNERIQFHLDQMYRLLELYAKSKS
jgi:hypothetical protein